jgi:hypothetical protein
VESSDVRGELEEALRHHREWRLALAERGDRGSLERLVARHVAGDYLA